MVNYLESTFYFDADHSAVQHFVNSLQLKDFSPKSAAIKLFEEIRDGWKYNPYVIHFMEEKYLASQIIQRETGHCLDKSILLITCLRALNIPARLGLAKVKNHIGVETIVEKFSSEVLTPHGYVEIYLNEKWVAATPAFNKELCKKLNVELLNFDGENDAVFQPNNNSGNKFMEYLEDYGTFDDFPMDFIIQNFKNHYKHLIPFIEKKETWRI